MAWKTKIINQCDKLKIKLGSKVNIFSVINKNWLDYWVYKRSHVSALDHPWWKHSTGVSKRWLSKLYSFKTRVVSNLAWLTTWLLRELLSIPLHLLFVKTLEHAKVLQTTLRLGYQAICLLVRCQKEKNLGFQSKEHSLTLTSTICTFM